jgi:hypothetical protein
LLADTAWGCSRRPANSNKIDRNLQFLGRESVISVGGTPASAGKNVLSQKITLKRNRTFLALGLLVFLIISCKKSDDHLNGFLVISPEKVTSYAGKNWSAISKEFKHKKGYKYSELNNGSTRAAISLPAKDPDAPSLNYTLLFNVDQQDRVSAIVLQTTDSLDIETSDKLFLYYYERAISLLDGVYYTQAIDNYDQHVNIPVDELLAKVRTLHWEEAALNIKNSRMDLQAQLSHGAFSYIIYPI